MKKLEKIGELAKGCTQELMNMKTAEKNKILLKVADSILQNEDTILQANEKDVKNAQERRIKESLIDRLNLDSNRIKDIVEGIKSVALLPDPIGEVVDGKRLENGLEIIKKRVPLGVIAIIYEARPNVTADAFSLCFKTGNVVILKGGSDAINTNIEMVKIIRKTLEELNVNPNCISLIEDTTKEAAMQLMKMNKYVDVLIPRGGANLIKTVVENSNVPVIETGSGNCHIYVDEFADFDKALKIIKNAKTQRVGVCNSCESLVINKKILKEFLPQLVEMLEKNNVEVRGDEECKKVVPRIKLATEEDFETEYLDLIISIKTVDKIEDAIGHINKNSTKHSESIITENYQNAQKFLNEIDSSCVYVNASTRFTDGGQFGFGAEIGISTQKLHARGPMGLKELTTTKYVIYGDVQIRE